MAVASAFRSCTEDQVLLCRIHTPNGRHPSGVGLQTVPHPAHRFPPGSYVQGSPSFLHCSSFTLVAYPLPSLWFPYYPIGADWSAGFLSPCLLQFRVARLLNGCWCVKHRRLRLGGLVYRLNCMSSITDLRMILRIIPPWGYEFKRN